MSDFKHRTIEDRLEEIEHGVHEIKSILLKLSIPKTLVAEKLIGEFMNVKEVANFAKVETSRVYSACAKNELKYLKLGKSYKFKKQDILEWLDSMLNQNSVNVDEYVEKYLQKHVLKG
jgi:excisionase family DNA binding protein